MPRKPKAQQKKTMSVAHWKDEIFNIEHRVVYCTKADFSAFCAATYQKRIDEEDLSTAGAMIIDDDNHAVVQYWFNAEESGSLSTSVIAHEASHGVDMVFKGRGIHPGYKATETRAYYLGALMRALPYLLRSLKAPVAKDL